MDKFIEKMKNFTGVLAIDGRCGAGKSTLAFKLKELYDFQIIHMDDFFLPFEKRDENTFVTIAGNIDIKRFCEEIIYTKSPVISYKKYNCKQKCFTEEVVIDKRKPLIIEGAYALHPKFVHIYDFKIFLDITKSEQKKRIINRNGVLGFDMFEKMWIPLEEKYIKEFEIEKLVDIRL